MLTPLSIALLSALFAGLVAVAVTVAIERWGGVVGGFLATLPTTIVPAAIGIHATAPSTEAFGDAMLVTPAGMFLNAGFLFLWRALPPRLPVVGQTSRLALMILISLGAWFLGALGLVAFTSLLRDRVVSLAPFGLGVTALLLTLGILACRRRRPAPRGHRRVGWAALVGRGLLAATAIAGGVGIAARGNALAAGVASVFPPIFVTTMVSLWVAQGEAVPTGAVGPMMLGSTSVAAYALLASQTLPAWGPLWGSLAAWPTSALLITLPASLWMRRRP